MNVIYKLNNRTVFKHSHELNLAIYDLNLIALDIFYILISQIRHEDKHINTYIISITDLEKTMASNGNNTRLNRDSLKAAAKELMDKKIIIETNDINFFGQWFDSITINSKEGYIQAKVSDTLKDHLFNLEQYIKGDLISFLKLRSAYSKILYVYFCKNLNRKTFKEMLGELHALLNVPDSLKNTYGNFKNRALLAGIEEINEKTNLKIDFEEIKFGRSVGSIEFHVKENNTKKSTNTVAENSGVSAAAKWAASNEDNDFIEADIVD